MKMWYITIPFLFILTD